MPSGRELLMHLYDRFNARDMEVLLATMHQDVVWANGLEGGHVYGHAGVRDYWTRQWAMMNSHVEPVGFWIGARWNERGRGPPDRARSQGQLACSTRWATMFSG